MVFYVKIGKTDWSLRLAESVSMTWKCIVGLALCSSVGYTAWHAARHIAGIRRVRKSEFWYVEKDGHRHA